MNKKIYPIGFVLMLAINIGLAVFIVSSSQNPPKRENRRPTENRISTQLGFDDAQNTKYAAMVRDHREKMREVGRSEKDLVSTYFKSLALNEKDTSLNVVLQKICALKKDRILITYQHLEEVKSLCTAEQLEKFDEVIEDLIPRLTGAHRRPGHRPPHHGRR